MKALPLIAAFLMVGSGSARTEEEKFLGCVEFDLLIVQMSESVSIPILSALKEPDQAPAAREKIIRMIGEKKAKLQGWPVLQTNRSSNASTQQTEQIRYAIGYDNPAVKLTQAFQEPSQPKPDTELQSEKHSVFVESTYEGVPNAFDTKEVGVTFEATGTISPDWRVIEASILARHSRLIGYEKTEIKVERDSSKTTITVEQPKFHSNTVRNEFTIQDGTVMLLGSYKLPDKEDTIELFVLRTRILK